MLVRHAVQMYDDRTPERLQVSDASMDKGSNF
jgi:hypothetical protein